MNSSLQIILLSGTPGVGKTTVADSLHQRGFQVLSLNDFIISNGLYFGFDYIRESVIIDEEIVQIKLLNLFSTISGYLIIESHAAEIVPPEFVHFVIILRCAPNILRARLEQFRKYSKAKINENIQAEIMEECLIAAQEIYPAEKIIQIDSSFSSPDEIAEKIISIIS
ncbi:MAG: adenylate kinase family protein [Candidatus Heimdallarchaeota archaeon]|nr:adenylate kinase family protein [Candidatus Heimdallarchaeota archaeon]